MCLRMVYALAMIKIDTFTLSRQGTTGSKVTLPAAWVKDLGLKPGDRLDIYRDEEDRIIVCVRRRVGNILRRVARTRESVPHIDVCRLLDGRCWSGALRAASDENECQTNE